jgi:hypothetical protein
MLDTVNQQISDSKTLLKQAKTDLNRKKRYSLANSHKACTKQIADLEWQVKFTQMKLNLWRDLENGQWTALKEMHEMAKSELRQIKAA